MVTKIIRRVNELQTNATTEVAQTAATGPSPVAAPVSDATRKMAEELRELWTEDKRAWDMALEKDDDYVRGWLRVARYVVAKVQKAKRDLLREMYCYSRGDGHSSMAPILERQIAALDAEAGMERMGFEKVETPK